MHLAAQRWNRRPNDVIGAQTLSAFKPKLETTVSCTSDATLHPIRKYNCTVLSRRSGPGPLPSRLLAFLTCCHLFLNKFILS